MQAALAIVFVLALAWVLTRWLPGRSALLARVMSIRPRATAAEKVIQVKQRVHLTPHHSLHVVSVADRTLLVGAHAGGITLLCTLANGPADIPAQHQPEVGGS